MSNGLALAKIVAIIAVVIMFTAALTGTTPSEWTAVQESIAAGIEFPSFWNPFTEEIIRITAFADLPVRYHSSNGYDWNGEQWIGCENTTSTRARCLATIDGDASFVRVPVDPESGFQTGFSFNYSNQDFKNLNATRIRQVVITMHCRTEVNGTSALSFFTFFSYDIAFLDILTCPMSAAYGTIIKTIDFPNGMPVPPLSSGTPFNDDEGFYDPGAAQFQIGTQQRLDDDPIIENVGLPNARFSYIKVEIAYATGDDCSPPDGAWFPVLDEIACAIINFANFVWKGIQLIGSGIAFIILSAVTLIGFIGGIIVNILIGTASVYGTLFSLGAPSPAQEIINVLVIAMAAYLIFIIVSIVRGTEG